MRHFPYTYKSHINILVFYFQKYFIYNNSHHFLSQTARTEKNLYLVHYQDYKQNHFSVAHIKEGRGIIFMLNERMKMV